MDGMEFRKVIYFLKVAETLNYRRAAAELFISPQALSKHIQDLEHILGYTLLRRSTTKVELTDEGKVFYTRFRRVWDEWQAAWEESAASGGTIMWLSNLTSGVQYETTINYLTAICKELGYDFTVVYGDSFNDAAGNLQPVKNGMRSDVVGLITS